VESVKQIDPRWYLVAALGVATVPVILWKPSPVAPRHPRPFSVTVRGLFLRDNPGAGQTVTKNAQWTSKDAPQMVGNTYRFVTEDGGEVWCPTGWAVCQEVRK